VPVVEKYLIVGTSRVGLLTEGPLVDGAFKVLPADKKMIGTPTSDEEPNTNTTSPVASFKGYKTKRTNDNG
jgi:hypothetical protein